MPTVHEISYNLTYRRHIVAELSGHVTRFLDESARLKFWNISIEYLQSKDFSETLIELVNLYESRSWLRHLVPRIGVSDTGLIQLAFDLGADLLTEDRKTLASNVDGQIVNCVVVSEILPK